MRKNANYLIRKSHRYLGIFIGIQFLFWTIGGLYFSWNNIDEVHGDHLHKKPAFMAGDIVLASPGPAIEQLRAIDELDSIIGIELVNILDSAAYRITYLSKGNTDINQKKVALANGASGLLRNELTKEEAVRIAEALFITNNSVAAVDYITEVGKHSEYREKPLPAWVIRFVHPDNPTIYVGAKSGTFEAIRHDTWRTFDFLWMLHTMDYEGRDIFGNYVLKSFSILGLITVMSGFLLFYISSPTVRKWKKRFKTGN
jgi:uncharacterized iron-regulated membrane protein